MKFLAKYKNLPKGLKASFWFAISSLFQKGLAFLATPLYTRLLTQNEYGVFSVYTSWLSVITIFATFNLSAGVLNNALTHNERFGLNDDKIISNFQFLEIISICAVTAVLLLIKAAIPSLISISFSMLLMMAVTIFFTSAISLWSVKEKFRYRYRSLVLVTLASSIVTIMLNLFFIKYGSNKEMALIYGGTLASFLVYIIIFVNNLVKGKSFFNFKLWRYAILFNLPLLPHYLASAILVSSDKIVIESFCGHTDVALYSIAYSIGSVVMVLVTAINSSLAPFIYQCISNKRPGQINKVASYSFFLVFLVAFLIVTIGPELILLMGGEKYFDARWIIPPVAGAIVFSFMYPMFSNIEFYFEKRIVTMLASCFAAFLNIVLNIILIPVFGYIAAAFTTFLCYAILSAIHYFAYSSVCKKNKIKPVYNKKILILFSVLTILMIPISYFLYLNDVLRYVFILILITCFLFGGKRIIHRLSDFVKKV